MTGQAVDKEERHDYSREGNMYTTVVLATVTGVSGTTSQVTCQVVPFVHSFNNITIERRLSVVDGHE